MSVGRPTTYTEEIGLEICRRMAEGESVRRIARDAEMPVASTIFLWVIDGKHNTFSEQYARARQVQADNMFEEMLEIADDGSNDFMEVEISEGLKLEKYNPEHVQRSRLRLDTRKWALSKMLPKIYGDKLHTEHSGDIGVNPAAAFLEALRKNKEGKG
jgi:hypothetical protein